MAFVLNPEIILVVSQSTRIGVASLWKQDQLHKPRTPSIATSTERPISLWKSIGRSFHDLFGKERSNFQEMRLVAECFSAGRRNYAQKPTGSFVPVLRSRSGIDGQSLPDTTRLFIALFYVLQQHGSALCIEIVQPLFSQLCDQKRGQNAASSVAAMLIDFDHNFVVTIEGDVSPLVALAKQYYAKWSMKQLPAPSADVRDSVLSALSMECTDELAEFEEISGYDRSQFSSFADALLVERGIPCFPDLPAEYLESPRTSPQNAFAETVLGIVGRQLSVPVFLNLVGTDV